MTVLQNDPAARLIAFYLPQYHPIPENDQWWGKGFTEWTNVAKAKPLFPGHYQPHIPADLGFYDLRVPETRAAQAELAQQYGIEAFCYYHYWFAGRRLLERPFAEVLSSGEPNFPFCLCWANETWAGRWHGADNKTLIEQTYPGPEDNQRHFYELLKAFSDPRYLKVDDKPLFIVYNPFQLPEPKRTLDQWRELALQAGLKGLYLLGYHTCPEAVLELGFDAAIARNMQKLDTLDQTWVGFSKKLLRKLMGYPVNIYPYRKALSTFLMPEATHPRITPCVVPNWDNTPRAGRRGLVLDQATPELFRRHLKDTLSQIQGKPEEHRLVFIKSWNEWAEGNYLEPDLKYGKAYLEVVRDEVMRSSHRSS